MAAFVAARLAARAPRRRRRAAPRRDRPRRSAGRARAARARPARRPAPRPRRGRRRGRRRARRRRPGDARAACRCCAPLAPRRDLGGGRDLRAQPLTRASRRASPRPTSTTASTTPSGPRSSSRTPAAAARSGPTSPSPCAASRPGRCRRPSSALVLGADGEILAFIGGNDLTARDIEAANPLYIPQAKLFAACCAIGPAVLVPDDPGAPLAISVRIWDAAGTLVNEDGTSTAKLHRSLEELAGWCVRENPVPDGHGAAHGHRHRAARRRRARARLPRRGRGRGDRHPRQPRARRLVAGPHNWGQTPTCGARPRRGSDPGCAASARV